MDAETLFTIDGGKLVALTRGPLIPRGIGTAISYNMGAFVENPGLMIGSWDQTGHEDRPAVMSFTANGTIVSVVVANMDGDTMSARDRIEAIQKWLAPMQLRDLSQLFTDPGTFYEGLWDMSPNTTIALQKRRRFVVISAEDDVDRLRSIEADLEGIDIEIVHLDVFTSEAGDVPIIRWSPLTGQTLAEPTSDTSEAVGGLNINTVGDDGEGGLVADGHHEHPVDASASPADVHETSEPEIDLVDEPEAAIDLTESAEPDRQLRPVPVVDISDDALLEPPPPPSGDSSGAPPVINGRTYAIDTLPFLFDPDDELLDSISDEMFAVPGHVVLVDKLPERRRQPSPFENPGRYRWDADTDQQTTLENNLMDHHGTRLIHLFVESDRQAGLATYVGLLTAAADNHAGRYNASMWFDVAPKISPSLWQLLRKGRLPELGSPAELSTQS